MLNAISAEAILLVDDLIFSVIYSKILYHIWKLQNSTSFCIGILIVLKNHSKSSIIMPRVFGQWFLTYAILFCNIKFYKSLFHSLIMRECRSGQTGRTQNKNHVLKLPRGAEMLNLRSSGWQSIKRMRYPVA